MFLSEGLQDQSILPVVVGFMQYYMIFLSSVPVHNLGISCPVNVFFFLVENVQCRNASKPKGIL